jgi:hypothetical protein
MRPFSVRGPEADRAPRRVTGAAESAGVDVAAVAYGRDADYAVRVIDRINDPVVADPDAP